MSTIVVKIKATGPQGPPGDAGTVDLTLTTVGNDGPATLVGTILNVPEYVGAGGGTTVESDATLSGTGAVASPLSVVNDGHTHGTQYDVVGAGAAAVGAHNVAYDHTKLAEVDGKQGALTLTTVGTSGAATLIGDTLNVPQYEGGGGGHIIEDEGVPLDQQDTLNFTGAGVTVTDSGGKTVVSIPGGGISTVSSDSTLSGDGSVGDPLSVVNDGHTHATQYDPLNTASGLVTAHNNAFAHSDISHANRAALDLVSGTNTGDQTDITAISSTKTEFDTALTDGSFVFVGDEFNHVKLNNTPVAVPSEGGVLSWDDLHKTVQVQIEDGAASPILQLGQELYVRVYNNTGSIITNGQAVYVDGVDSHHPSVSLAQADASSTAGIVGLATQNIAIGGYGMVCKYGQVHGFDTSGYTVGDHLYLSSTVAGGLTDARPMPPNYDIGVAVVMEIAVDGTIFVDPTLQTTAIDLTDAAVSSKDPTGWLDNDNIQIDYDPVARTITLTPLTGTLRYVWRGFVVDLGATWTSDPHADTPGSIFFLYSTNGMSFTWSDSAWTFNDLMVAFVEYGATSRYAVREVHGTMSWQAHEEFHQQIGTYRVSGGTLSGYALASTVAANRRPTVAQSVIKDEDIRTTLPEWNVDTLGATQFYLTGAGPTSVLTPSAADIVPVLAARPYYNQFTGGSWQQTVMTNNLYQAVFLLAVPVADDTDSQVYRYWWIQGQQEGALADIQAVTPFDLNLGQLPTITPEFVFISKIILRYTAGNWQLTSVENLTGNRAAIVAGPSGTYLSTVVSDNTINGSGTSGDPLSVARDTADPEMNGTAAVGTSVYSARHDHVHPTDTNREPANANIQSHIGVTDGNPHGVDIDDLTPTTTKGDIIVENGANAVRVGVGSNGQMLTANSAVAEGVEWTTPTTGDVTKSGTPANDQLAVWTADGIIEGDANLTWNGTALNLTGGIAATGVISSDGVTLTGDQDLSGYVSKVGTPADNQLGVWTGDGTLEGDANLTWDGADLSIGGNVAVTGSLDASAFVQGSNLIAEATGEGIALKVTGFTGQVNNIVLVRDGSLAWLFTISPSGDVYVAGDISIGGTVVDPDAEPNLTLAQQVTEVLTAVPQNIWWVYGDSSDGGTTPDTPTQASIDAWLAVGVPEANLKWLYTPPDTNFRINSPTLQPVVTGADISLTAGLLGVSDPTLQPSVGSATLVNTFFEVNDITLQPVVNAVALLPPGELGLLDVTVAPIVTSAAVTLTGGSLAVNDVLTAPAIGAVAVTTIPTVTSAVIPAAGTSITLTFNTSVSIGAGGSGGFNVDGSVSGNDVSMTYSSGAPGTSLVFTLGATIQQGETVNLDYTQPGNGIESTFGLPIKGDLASITDGAVTNNSTVSASNDFTEGFESAGASGDSGILNYLSFTRQGTYVRSGSWAASIAGLEDGEGWCRFDLPAGHSGGTFNIYTRSPDATGAISVQTRQSTSNAGPFAGTARAISGERTSYPSGATWYLLTGTVTSGGGNYLYVYVYNDATSEFAFDDGSFVEA